jgi:hypothetical protein
MSRADRLLATRLRAAELPDAVPARDRAWELVAAAYAERDAEAPPRRGRAPALVGRPHRHAGRLAVIAVAACVALVAIALSPPGDAVGGWLRHVVRPMPARAPAAHPSLGPLPGQGRLLVVGPSGPWIVQRDGSRRRLGSYDDAVFSPHGLFVAVTRDRMLAAVDPRGGVRWTLTRAARVTHPVWSPDGFRIAYRAGRTLRVVYGDGSSDRLLAARSAAVTPAWRPGQAAHQLAFARGATGRAGPGGAASGSGATVVLRDVDTGRELWRARLAVLVRGLEWAPDGRRLLVVGPAGVTILGARGQILRSPPPAPPGTRMVAARWLPGGGAFALLRTTGAGASDIVLVRVRGGQSARVARRLLAIPGRLTGMLVSPDGRWLVLSAPDANQWLLVRTGPGGRISARSDVARQFDPAARSPGRAPRLAGWTP